MVGVAVVEAAGLEVVGAGVVDSAGVDVRGVLTGVVVRDVGVVVAVVFDGEVDEAGVVEEVGVAEGEDVGTLRVELGSLVAVVEEESSSWRSRDVRGADVSVASLSLGAGGATSARCVLCREGCASSGVKSSARCVGSASFIGSVGSDSSVGSAGVEEAVRSRVRGVTERSWFSGRRTPAAIASVDSSSADSVLSASVFLAGPGAKSAVVCSFKAESAT